jgi:UrcA family protein
MNNAKIRSIYAAAIGAALALGFGTAGASEETEFVRDGVSNYVVRFPDLDLSKVEGAAALYSRLNHAARVVCAPVQRPDIAGKTQYRLCLQQAVANAVASINRPMVWQYHETRTKGDKGTVVQLAKAN